MPLTLLRLCLAALACVVSLAAAEIRPNIVVLLADDLGINDLGCYGRKDHRTPNLDRLATEGIRFTSAYAAASVCSASRAALLTGQAPARLGITTFLPGRPERSSHALIAPTQNESLPNGVKTLAEFLKPAGYATGAVGKWHLGGKDHLPTRHGFDAYFPTPANPPAARVEAAGGKGERLQADLATQFIAENKSKPFFLYVAFDSPHIPLGATAEQAAAQAGSFNPKYAATVASLDAAVGKVLAAIEANGLSGKTIVVFASDNGGVHLPELKEDAPTHNTPFRAGKGFLYEGGIRVPLIVRLPTMTKGRTDDAPTSLGDLTPTLAALALATPANVAFDFNDVSSQLLGTAEKPAVRTLAWHQPHYLNQGGRPAGALREGDWKLIENYEDGSLELYNLKDDPSEATDLAAKQPAKVAELRGKLEAWRRKVGAKGMATNPQFNRAAWEACYAKLDVSKVAPGANAVAMSPALAAWRQAMDATPAAGANAWIRLEARDAKVQAKKLKYEDPPQKDTLGFWVDPTDTASWTFKVDQPGKYRVTVLQGCGKGSGGATVALEAGSAKVEFTVEETGHFQRFIPREVGALSLAAGENTLVVRPLKKKGAAVMDLRRVTLERVE
jgi:arylsulfatase A